MKKTLFLSYILAALLACSAAPHAYAYDEDADDDYTLTDRDPRNPWDSDADEGTNILDVYEDADDEWDDSWGFYVSMGNPIYVNSKNGYIIYGGVTGPIYINPGMKLTFDGTGCLMFSSDDIDLTDLDDDEVLSITMYDQSTLDYGHADLLLGPFNFALYNDRLPTVNLFCNNLVARSVDNSARDFRIRAKINFLNDESRLVIPGEIQRVNLDCEQDLNLQTWNYYTYIGKDGQFHGVSGGTKLIGAAINLPDNKTSNIDGYLGGTTTLTLGNGTTLQGLRQYWSEEQTGISWLTNNIVVRENCSATMQTGYYGGTITMRIGSSLKFDMDLIPAGVDPDHLEGGAEVIMYSGTTLDLAGRTTPLDLTVKDSRNTVKNGTITSRMTLEDYASLDWYGGDMNLSTSGVTLGRNAVLNLHGKTINGDVWCASGARVEHGTITGWFNMADGETYSWWALGNAGLTLRGGVCLGDNTTLDLDDTNNTYTHSIALKGSATIGNGKLDGAFSVGGGKVLTLCGDFSGTGAVTLYEGAKLDLAAHKLVRDVTLDGSATITGGEIVGTLTVSSGKRLTLGGDLTGTGTVSLKGGATLALGSHVFTKAVTVGSSSLVTISGGTIDIGVSLQDNANLSLESVKLGDNTSFTLGDGSRLNLSGASETGTAWFNPNSGATATVESKNVRIGLPGAPVGPETHDAMVYTVSFSGTDHKPTYIEGNYIKLKLEENIKFATRHNTRYLVEEACIGNPNRPVSLDVKAEGHFLLGDFYNEQGARGTKTVYGDVNVCHTGEGLSDNTGTADVDILYRLIGNLSATEMKGGAIFIGAIGYERDAKKDGDVTIPGGTVTVGGASRITVSSFIGQSMELAASGAVMLTGNGRAYGAQWNGAEEVTALKDSATLVIGGVEEDRPEINFQANLSAHTIALTGTDISGTGAYGDMSTGAAFVEFADSCTINATEAIDIKQGFKGGNLTVTGGGNVMLDLLGISEDAPLAKAEIISQNNGITMRSFTGGSLSATAKETVTIGGNVTASTGDIELTGSSVSIGGSLAASSGSNNIKSTTGDISIGGTLSAQDTSTLESAANIIIEGNVTGGALMATAAQSISLQAITIGDKAADLTATNGSITAGAFTGGSLTAKAAKAVTFSGDVASRNNTKLSGASVGVNGSLTTLYGRTQIASTGGDIIIGGTLSSGTSSTLDSAENITIGGNMTGGALTAKAAQSISLQAITIGDKAAALTATGGSIAAGAFTGASLTAEAAGAVTINGDVAASVGDAELTGSIVSIQGSLAASEASANITSTTGDIEITGTLSAQVSSILNSAADITIGGNVTGGALTAKAANSIKLKDIIIGTNDAELTATNGSISAESFTGAALTAGAAGAVTINGNVASTGNTDLTGGSVTINGSLTSSNGKNDIKSTSGDIVIGGDLSAWVSSTLDSEGSIILGTLDDKGEITAGGNVTCGHLIASARGSIKLGAFSADDLTASAGGSIKVGNIGSTSQAVGTVELTATNGGITAGNVTGGALTVTAGQSITAGNVTAGLLTATAAGTITMNNVAVSQSEAQIVSTGEGGDVVLNAFDGGGALIKATHGSITVALGVTGSASTNKNNFFAAGSVTFNGATGDNGLEHAIINAPQVNWSNGTTLKNVTVSRWVPPANSPLLLLAAGNGEPQATLTVNGFLELTEYSIVNGNVVINKQDNIIPAVTVTSSTITGQVSGVTQLVLNNGSVGNVVVDNNSPNDLTVVSSGTSSITSVPFYPTKEKYAKLRIPALSLKGGQLTVSPMALDSPDDPDYPDYPENGDEERARLQVDNLTVENTTTLYADLELLPVKEDEFTTMTFNLSAANETAACLNLQGDFLSYIRDPRGFSQLPGGKVTVTLNGDASVEGGKRYALIATNYANQPDFWNGYLTLAVSGLAQKTDELFWDNGTLYFQNGGELTRAVWSPETSHQWNTTDLNWLQDGHRYRYKDGVTVVFDDTGKGGVVELEGDYAPGEVQVNNSAENGYTFTGTGRLTGESTKLIKMGSGTLTIQTANSYGGGTTIHAGTLVVDNEWALGSGNVTLENGIQEEVTQEGGSQEDVTQEGGTLLLRHNGEISSFDMVTLQCGTVQIDNGPKKFRLTVTGQNTRLEGSGHNAFTGTLTLKVGSQLNSYGGALMATQYGIDHIVMENGSTLTMTSDDDNAHRIWINKVSEFTVYAGTEQDAPKLVDTYLYIDSGFTYTLGATTEKNINSLQNLRGEGSTAFLLNSSTLDLNSKTTKLNIIVDNELPQGPSTVMGGEIDANVVVCEKTNPSADPNELEVINARIGNNASISLGAGTRLIMSDVAIGAGATFSMGNAAYLDLGGTFAHPSSVSLGAFTFTGANATIDNGSLYVERKETGAPVVLGTNLQGEKTYVSLHEEASLDLGGHVLSVKEVSMSEDAASASIGNGTLNSALAVESGKTLHLGNALTIAGNLSGGGTITKENDGTASVSGGMEGFTGNVQVQGGELNIMGIAEAASLKVADVTIMSGTLGVYQGGTTGEENEGTLTIRSGSKLAAGHGAKLNANLVMVGGSTLDVHSTEGAGLLMGSTVTLSKGMTLKDYSADWATWKDGTKYVLFSGVDGLDISNGNGIMTGTLDYTQWVDAKEYFTNIEESNRYFLCYNGGNVGTVYIMQMLEHATATLIWNGSAGHMTWDATDTNWLLGDQSTTHMDSADVVFNNTGAGGVVQLGGELAPMSVLVEGTCDYTFTGTGRLIGNVALTKDGDGTLTIENANNYSGDTIIKGGTLALGNDATLGSGTVTLEENGTLKLANGTFANDIQGNGTLVKDLRGTANVTGSMEDFSGNVVVDGGTLNLMNAASLNMADVAINFGSLGVYTGGVAAEANEGTFTITGGHTLTAGIGATLNANLVMGGGSTLDVSAMAGLGGLQMGSTVTLNPGLVLLSDEDMDAVGALGFMGKYDLFNSVDGLSLDGTSNFLAELGLADKWVKAADVFANDLFKEAEKEYYVFYSGANQAGGNRGNVGTVYIMQIPEPTTSTLSLLALAALAARRRKD